MIIQSVVLPFRKGAKHEIIKKSSYYSWCSYAVGGRFCPSAARTADAAFSGVCQNGLLDLPALIGAFAYGPRWGVVIEAVKNALHLMQSATGGVGELANFLIGSALVVPAGIIYMKNKCRRNALIGCIVGSFCMGIAAALANYYILLPLFQTFMPMDEMIAAFAAFIPVIDSKRDIVLLSALPMNILKGLMISLVTTLIYKRLSPILKGR